jgi:hemerythrin superfamily protein
MPPTSIAGAALASAAAVDCLNLLKEQHDEAKDIFKKLESAEGARAAQLFGELKTKLTMHEELEETHLYPELKKEDTTEDLVLESYQEHHVMDVLISEISKLKPSDEEFQPKIKVLQENTEHHIEEEEKELFPKVRKIWNPDRRRQVGELMERLRNQLQKSARAA